MKIITYKCDLCNEARDVDSTTLDYAIFGLRPHSDIAGNATMTAIASVDANRHVCVRCAKAIAEIVKRR